ncbi:MAG: hypothetical protein GJ679_01825, partial [Rhodobacteraceae bacterium]|nr:hypothetical protein [Paracoccaceae bacterium]
SFMRFLGLGLEDRVPDAKTVWLYREGLAKAGMGGALVRTIGLARAKAKIGMKNLAYNIRRLAQLRRINPCPVLFGART